MTREEWIIWMGKQGLPVRSPAFLIQVVRVK